MLKYRPTSLSIITQHRIQLKEMSRQSMSLKYRLIFFNFLSDVQYQSEKQLQPTRATCTSSRVFPYKRYWLINFFSFHFGIGNGEEGLKNTLYYNAQLFSLPDQIIKSFIPTSKLIYFVWFCFPRLFGPFFWKFLVLMRHTYQHIYQHSGSGQGQRGGSVGRHQ